MPRIRTQRAPQPAGITPCDHDPDRVAALQAIPNKWNSTCEELVF
jgi:hypothetical protein